MFSDIAHKQIVKDGANISIKIDISYKIFLFFFGGELQPYTCMSHTGRGRHARLNDTRVSPSETSVCPTLTHPHVPLGDIRMSQPERYGCHMQRDTGVAIHHTKKNIINNLKERKLCKITTWFRKKIH